MFLSYVSRHQAVSLSAFLNGAICSSNSRVYLLGGGAGRQLEEAGAARADDGGVWGEGHRLSGLGLHLGGLLEEADDEGSHVTLYVQSKTLLGDSQGIKLV